MPNDLDRKLESATSENMKNADNTLQSQVDSALNSNEYSSQPPQPEPFVDTPPEPIPEPEQPETIPNAYGLDKIVLLVRDPSWIHSYWDITSGKFYQALESLGLEADEEAEKILRVYDATGAEEITEYPNATGNATLYFDIHLDEGARNSSDQSIDEIVDLNWLKL